MKGIMDYYDKTALEWAKMSYTPDPEIPALLDFARRFPPGSRFLDLCCGCGCESQRIHAMGYEVVGLDFSEESLKIARERNPDIVFYQDDLRNDYSYIGKVDAVIVIAGLVHIEKDQLPLAFSRMRDVMKDEGRLFITVREGQGKIEKRSQYIVDGETYDRAFFGHSLEELQAAASGMVAFEQGMGDDGTGWHNYIFTTVKEKESKKRTGK